METEEKQTKPRIGIAHFERRNHRRFSVNLPIEYCRIDSSINCGRATHSSGGGLLIYFPEKMEISQHLKLKLFFTLGADLNTIEALAEVVWMDIHVDEAWSDYRSGVRFINIASGDMTKLKQFLQRLSE